MKKMVLLLLLLCCLTGCAGKGEPEPYVPPYVDQILGVCAFEEITPVLPKDVVKIELRRSSEVSPWIHYYEEQEEIDKIFTWLSEQRYQQISVLRASYLRNHKMRDGDPTYMLVFYTEDSAEVLDVSYIYLRTGVGSYYLCDELWDYMDELESWNVPNEAYDWREKGPIDKIPH